MKTRIPIALILFRLILAPVILFIAWKYKHAGSTCILILMYLGLLSDIFDGIIARNLQVSSASLRRMDSQTDMIFWLSIGISTWMLYPQLIKDNAVPITIIFVMEAMCYIISIARFGKETCTHAFLSKCGD